MPTLLLIRHGIAEDPQPGQRDAETMTYLQEAAGAFPMETRLELTPGGRAPKVC